jgi:hypothetical protein
MTDAISGCASTTRARTGFGELYAVIPHFKIIIGHFEKFIFEQKETKVTKVKTKETLNGKLFVLWKLK